ncbi:hypothetical protein VIPARAQ4037_0825 [Vibrio parahaemolyticus AQ4037]|nr:hypothetical protein VIPARAQ4037_0825 [Vibrio parahaemolyticus AQ4037]
MLHQFQCIVVRHQNGIKTLIAQLSAIERFELGKKLLALVTLGIQV